MSNTSTVTPYASRERSSGASGVGDALGSVAMTGLVGTLAGTAAVTAGAMKWLMAETSEDRSAVLSLKEARRRERIEANRAPERLATSRSETEAVTTVSLLLRNAETLVQSANRLGYRLESLMLPAHSLAEQPVLLLSGERGERLAIEKTADGTLTIHTMGGQSRVHRLVHQHSDDRTRAFFSGKHMSVRTHALPSGEIQMLAQPTTNTTEDYGMLKVQIETDGRAWVDVSCTKGTQCETIVKEFAEAVGAEVISMTKKDAFYELPGEPATVRVKV